MTSNIPVICATCSRGNSIYTPLILRLTHRTTMPNLVQLIQVFGPVKEIIVGLAITGSLIYSIPISNETKAKSSTRHHLVCCLDVTTHSPCRVLEPRRTCSRLALITFIMHSLNWAINPQAYSSSSLPAAASKISSSFASRLSSTALE